MCRMNLDDMDQSQVRYPSASRAARTWQTSGPTSSKSSRIWLLVNLGPNLADFGASLTYSDDSKPIFSWQNSDQIWSNSGKTRPMPMPGKFRSRLPDFGTLSAEFGPNSVKFGPH